ncbi:MAG: Ig domain-containing protein [Ruminococcaceae bacterium]|nr:Ig domain-containing protein [Oscillospiraceae bacterium]
MSLLKCPKCEEMFSDSYKTCPFCLEDEEFYSGRKPKNPGRRVEKQKAPSILGPAMVLVVLLLAAFLIYTFLGPTIAQWLKGEDEQPGIEQPVGGDEDKDNEDQDGDKDTSAITLDQTALTLDSGKTAQLTATGAENISWSSSDEAVATVDASGKVTAVGVGSATITAASKDATSAACVVTVNAPKKDLEVVTEYGASLYSPNKAFSVNRGGSVDLKVDGTDSTPTWTMSNTNVATVSSSGLVKGVSSGRTTLVVSVDGQTIEITVTVN